MGFGKIRGHAYSRAHIRNCFARLDDTGWYEIRAEHKTMNLIWISLAMKLVGSKMRGAGCLLQASPAACRLDG
jgi:hypothetical protein